MGNDDFRHPRRPLRQAEAARVFIRPFLNGPEDERIGRIDVRRAVIAPAVWRQAAKIVSLNAGLEQNGIAESGDVGIRIGRAHDGVRAWIFRQG